MTENSQFSK